MKSLDEKKLLAKMARNIGKPDLALEESIAKEENLTKNLFAAPKPREMTKQEVLMVEDAFFKSATPVEEEKQPPMDDLVQRAAAVIHEAPKRATPTTEDPISVELTRLRSQLADIMQKIGTMSWGGGGTGAVRFDALDDHEYPTGVRILEFNTAGPGREPPPGSLSWNTDEECLDITQPDGTTLQTGLEQYIRVHNHSDNTLTQGTFVMFVGVEEPHNGSTEHTPSAAPFTANGAFNPLYTIGVMTEDVLPYDNGRATTFGKVRNLNTTGTPVGETWNVGDILWAHPSIPGALTNEKPTVPDLVISVAAVLHVGTANGEILVRPTIYPLYHTGLFSSNVTQTAAQANTGYPISWNKESVKCPHVNRSNNNTAVQILEAGYFSFEFRLHIRAPKNTAGRIWIWSRVNSVDITDSATEISVEGSGVIEGKQYPSWSFVRPMQLNDEFQIMWATDNTQLSIYQPETTAFAPGSDSAVIRVTQVNL